MENLKCPNCGHENDLFTKSLKVTRNCARCGIDLSRIPGYEDIKHEAQTELWKAIVLAISSILFVVFFLGSLIQSKNYLILVLFLLILFISGWLQKPGKDA